MVDTRRTTLIVLTISTICVALCSYWAATLISRSSGPQLEGYVTSHHCLVANKTRESSNPKPQTTSSALPPEYRGVVFVKNYTIEGDVPEEDRNKEVRASRTGDLDREWTSDSSKVNRYLERFEINSTYTCYYKKSMPESVKMTLEPPEEPFRLVSIMLVVCSALLFVPIVFYMFRDELRHLIPAPLRERLELFFRDLTFSQGPSVTRLQQFGRDIDRKDIRRAISLLKVDKDTARRKLEEKWTCSICLEATNDELDKFESKLVELPCGSSHIVHAGCVYKWISNGGSTCPLCNFGLGPYIRSTVSPSREQRPGQSDSQESLSSVQSDREGGRERPQNQSVVIQIENEDDSG